jgi:hypothetical protein
MILEIFKCLMRFFFVMIVLFLLITIALLNHPTIT